MTPELQHRWQTGQAPFDGITVATCDDPDLQLLCDVLSFACARLRDTYPKICVFSDWHEHDGHIIDPHPADWDDFSRRLSSPEALYESRDPDVSVRIAMVPDSFEWLLRYNIEDSDDGFLQAWCDLDFSCTPESATSALVDELHSSWPGYTDISSAKEFFDHSYGG